MSSAQQAREQPPRLPYTPRAIGLAAAAGVPIGVFLSMCGNPPFGPVLLGWGVALLGAVVITAGLAVLARDHETMVGVGYAAGAAGSAVVTRMILSGVGNDWCGPLWSFAAILSILASVSLLGSVPCTILKWEDRKARQRSQAEEATRRGSE